MPISHVPYRPRSPTVGSAATTSLLRIVVPSVCSFQELMERLVQSDIGIEKFTSRIVLRQSSEKRIYSLSLIAAPRGGIGPDPVNHRHAISAKCRLTPGARCQASLRGTVGSTPAGWASRAISE